MTEYVFCNFVDKKWEPDLKNLLFEFNFLNEACFLKQWRVEFSLKIIDKKVRKKTAIAIDELLMFIATSASFLARLLLIWLIFSDEKAMNNLSK